MKQLYDNYGLVKWYINFMNKVVKRRTHMEKYEKTLPHEVQKVLKRVSKKDCQSREIVWPPVVIIFNTGLDKYDKGKRLGMADTDVLECISTCEVVRLQQSYGPSGHRGMSALIFKASALGFMDAKHVCKVLEDRIIDQDGFSCPDHRVLLLRDGQRNLYGHMAEKSDMELFNEDAHGNSKLKFEMRSYHEMVVIPMKQMCHDHKLLEQYMSRVAKENKHLFKTKTRLCPSQPETKLCPDSPEIKLCPDSSRHIFGNMGSTGSSRHLQIGSTSSSSGSTGSSGHLHQFGRTGSSGGSTGSHEHLHFGSTSSSGGSTGSHEHLHFGSTSSSGGSTGSPEHFHFGSTSSPEHLHFGSSGSSGHLQFGRTGSPEHFHFGSTSSPEHLHFGSTRSPELGMSFLAWSEQQDEFFRNMELIRQEWLMEEEFCRNMELINQGWEGYPSEWMEYPSSAWDSQYRFM